MSIDLAAELELAAYRCGLRDAARYVQAMTRHDPDVSKSELARHLSDGTAEAWLDEPEPEIELENEASS